MRLKNGLMVVLAGRFQIGLTEKSRPPGEPATSRGPAGNSACKNPSILIQTWPLAREKRYCPIGEKAALRTPLSDSERLLLSTRPAKTP